MLIAYEVALELRPEKHDNNLAVQLVDAANSTVQNLAAGARHRGGNNRARTASCAVLGQPHEYA